MICKVFASQKLLIKFFKPICCEIFEIAAVQKDANLVELEKMLSNAYFLAKFRFDTAENEPAKNLQNFVKFQKCQLDNLVDFEKCRKTRI